MTIALSRHRVELPGESLAVDATSGVVFKAGLADREPLLPPDNIAAVQAAYLGSAGPAQP